LPFILSGFFVGGPLLFEKRIFNMSAGETRRRLKEGMQELDRVVIGHSATKESMALCIISEGSIFLESAPGEGKTLAAKAFAKILGLTSGRIQFHPELRPSSILGYVDRDLDTGEPFLKKGPVFAEVVLADEITRGPSHLQSALLEPMQEHQATIPGWHTEQLPRPQFFLATYNPHEVERVHYPLSTAQIDRFLIKEKLRYPDRETLKQIMVHDADAALEGLEPVLDRETIRGVIEEVRLIWTGVDSSHPLVDYIARLAGRIHELVQEGEYGVTPRGCHKLWVAACAYAWLQGKLTPLPSDIVYPTEGSETPLIFRVWRHRLIVEDEEHAHALIQEAIDETPVLERLVRGVA